MKRAFTVTIENGSKLGKAVIMATSRKDAAAQALAAAPAGFRVSRVLDNSKEQRGFAVVDGHHRVKCSLGAVAEHGKLYKNSRKPAFFTGKAASASVITAQF